jgi:hypothetical protein
MDLAVLLDASFTPGALKKMSKSVIDISTLSADVTDISKSTTSLFAGGSGVVGSAAGGVLAKMKGKKKSKTESKTSLISRSESFESLDGVSGVADVGRRWEMRFFWRRWRECETEILLFAEFVYAYLDTFEKVDGRLVLEFIFNSFDPTASFQDFNYPFQTIVSHSFNFITLGLLSALFHLSGQFS